MSPARLKTVLALVVLGALLVVGYLLGPGGDAGTQAGPTPSRATGPSSAAPPASTRPATTRPTAPASSDRDPQTGLRWAELSALPRQAQQTVSLVERGGPYPYAKDGAVFENRQHLLPDESRGYYREYTVVTPGEGDRGARRIVTGDHDRLVFYTGDHYRSFVRVRD